MHLTRLDSSQQLALGIVACLALTGAALVAWATPLGPSVGSDSVVYLLSAESLLSGDGLGIQNASGEFAPLYPHFPPAYSLGLAAAGLFDRDLTADARWINVLAFGLLIAIVGVAPILLAGDSPLGIMLSVVALSSTALFRQFTAAMSEPLFILLATLGMFLLAGCLIGFRTATFYGAALALAMAALTRYVGLAFVGAGGLSVLSFGGGEWAQRTRKALAFALMGCLPLLVWLIAITRGGSQGVPRVLHPTVAGLWASLTEYRLGVVLSSWTFSPILGWASGSYDGRKILLIVGAAVWLVLLALALLPAKGAAGSSPCRRSLLVLTLVPAIFAAAYLLALAVAFAFSLPQPDINARMLSPVILPVWVSAISVWLLVAERHPKASFIRYVPWVFVALTAIGSVRSDAEFLQQMRLEGSGFTSRSWVSSPTLQAARGLPRDTALISNESAALMFLARRPAYDVPELVRRQEQAAFEPFGENRQDPVERLFREQGAALVLFDSSRGQFMGLYGERADERLAALTAGLDVYLDTPDGTIYLYPR
jgi:hypothetical protein